MAGPLHDLGRSVGYVGLRDVLDVLTHRPFAHRDRPQIIFVAPRVRLGLGLRLGVGLGFRLGLELKLELEFRPPPHQARARLIKSRARIARVYKEVYNTILPRGLMSQRQHHPPSPAKTKEEKKSYSRWMGRGSGSGGEGLGMQI